MPRNSINTLLLLVTTVNAYGVVRLQQNTDDYPDKPANPKDTEGEFSYVVSLQEWTKGSGHIINVARFCVGSAITNQWILTAGHCISKKLSHVEYGLKDNKNYSRILSKQVHPGYRMDYSFGGYYANLNNNIAMIKAEDMNLKKYARLSARQYSTIIGQIVKYAGYGGFKVKSAKDDNDGEEKGKNQERSLAELRVAEGGIIKCELERYIIIQPALCFAPKCGNRKLKSSQGDSGGPLTLDKRIIGVNSGYSPIMNDVFTPVSPFIDWISSTINRKREDKRKRN